MKNPIISVIIGTNTRKEFICEAIESVLNQSIPRDNFEIIVFKSFFNTAIDEFILNNVDRVIELNDEWQGSKWAEAIISSKGEIIAFLDDDDVFSNNKLNHIFNLYSNIHFDYYRNDLSSFTNISQISFETKIENSKIRIVNNKLSSKEKLRTIFNNLSTISSSSTVVSRKFIISCLEDLKSIKIAFDSYLFYAAIFKNVQVIVDRNELTFYRRHDSFTNSNKMDLNNLKNKNRYILDIMFSDYEIIRKLVRGNRTALTLVNNDLTQFKIFSKIYNKSEYIPIRDVVTYFFTINPGRSASKIFYILLYLSTFLSENMTRIVFAKLKSTFSKQ